MTMLYFVRHGETEWNVERRIQGQLDSKLTKNGIEKVKLLSEHLKQIEWETVYSSPLGRAYQTAQLLSPTTEIIKDHRLMEMHLGDFEGVLWSEMKEKQRTLYEYYWRNPSQFKHPSSESFYDLKERVTDFLHEISEQHQEGNILIVTHGVVIQVLQLIINKLPLNDLWLTPIVNGATVTKVEINNQTMKLVTIGEELNTLYE